MMDPIRKRHQAGHLAALSPSRRCMPLLRRAAAQDGANLVEFALSAFVLFSLMFGIMIMSIALYSYHYISEAAREGARYAMVRGSSCSSYGGFTATGTCPITASSTVQTYVRALGFPGIKTSNLNVTTTWSTNRTTWTATASSANAPGNYVKVLVSYTLPISIPFVSARTLTMNSTAITVIAD